MPAGYNKERPFGALFIFSGFIQNGAEHRQEAEIMEYELLLRVLIAGICGYIIGFERKSRMKEAGCGRILSWLLALPS